MPCGHRAHQLGPDKTELVLVQPPVGELVGHSPDRLNPNTAERREARIIDSGERLLTQPVTRVERDGSDTVLQVAPHHVVQWVTPGSLATVPRSEIVRRLGRLAPALMRRIDSALQDALGLGRA